MRLLGRKCLSYVFTSGLPSVHQKHHPIITIVMAASVSVDVTFPFQEENRKYHRFQSMKLITH